tara:strand:- start:1555 stop:2700 length:1146 start_codon:yes stop_codon:yes gene_type:complete
MSAVLRLDSLEDLIFRALEEEGEKEGPREHLGASEIGSPCERQNWYSFRWVGRSRFPGRIRRVFRRGQLEEDLLSRDLKLVKHTVHEVDPATGKQFRVNAIDGHFGGSMDGITQNVYSAKDKSQWHVLEYKTASKDSWRKLKKNGVKEANPQHYAQMQIYMYLSGTNNAERLTRAFYISVCKDDERIYDERVKLDVAFAKELVAKAKKIIESRAPMEKVKHADGHVIDDPDYFICKHFCNFSHVCHGSQDGKITNNQWPLVNCRTCLHSAPGQNGKWNCELKGTKLGKAEQLAACESHLFLPALVPTGREVSRSSAENWIKYVTPDGVEFSNGIDGTGVYGSRELRALDPRLYNEKNVEKLREKFDAKVEEKYPFNDPIPF